MVTFVPRILKDVLLLTLLLEMSMRQVWSGFSARPYYIRTGCKPWAGSEIVILFLPNCLRFAGCPIYTQSVKTIYYYVQRSENQKNWSGKENCRKLYIHSKKFFKKASPSNFKGQSKKDTMYILGYLLLLLESWSSQA